MNARMGVSILAIAVAAFAGGWHFGLFEAPRTELASTEKPAPASVAPSSTVAPSATAPAEQAAEATTAPAPSFDIVRVEPDGAAVVAGRAAPNATVRLQNGTEQLAEVKTDASGAFALDLTLPVGQHRLALNDTGRASDAASGETAIVNVPEKGRESELLVMLQRPGEASEILVKPASEPAATKDRTPADPSGAGTQVSSAQPAPDATPPVSAGAPARTLSVEAVEAENGKLFVAGAASERSKVRIYLDDALVSETEGGVGDRFIASALAGVAVGDHVVRADEVDGAGRVVARVEVPFNRPDTAPLAAIAPAPSEATAAAAPGEAGADVAATSGATLQPALERVEARVIIRKGDTLWRISRNAYGQGSRFTVIYLANGDQIRNPHRIYPGQVFRVPDKNG